MPVASTSTQQEKIQAREAIKQEKLQAKEIAKQEKLQAKEAAKQEKLQALEAAKQAKIQAREAAKQEKILARQQAKEAAKQEKIRAREEARRARILARYRERERREVAIQARNKARIQEIAQARARLAELQRGRDQVADERQQIRAILERPVNPNYAVNNLIRKDLKDAAKKNIDDLIFVEKPFSSEDCPICLNDLGVTNVMTLRCGHQTCGDCFSHHLQTVGGTKCPVCREQFTIRISGWKPPIPAI